MRTILLALALLAGDPAGAFCILPCDTHWSGPEATERLSYLLGPLPPGIEVERMVEGGFQDVFVQARLSVSQRDLRALLAWANIKKAAFGPPGFTSLGPEAPDWFDWERQEGVRVAEGVSDGGRFIDLAVAPDPEAPGRWRVYLFSFVT